MDNKVGLIQEKYKVTHADGTPMKKGFRFVLNIGSEDVNHMEASRAALLTYAHRIKSTNKTLCDDLKRILGIKVYPELTIEFFNDPRCPKEANYIGVNRKGQLEWFAIPPWNNGCGWCSSSVHQDVFGDLPLYFDHDDWENSLLERPGHVRPL